MFLHILLCKVCAEIPDRHIDNTDSIGSQESPEDLHPNNLINLSIHINLNEDEATRERDVDLAIIYNRVM